VCPLLNSFFSETKNLPFISVDSTTQKPDVTGLKEETGAHTYPTEAGHLGSHRENPTSISNTAVLTLQNPPGFLKVTKRVRQKHEKTRPPRQAAGQHEVEPTQKQVRTKRRHVSNICVL
jgi:hypothetical protein